MSKEKGRGIAIKFDKPLLGDVTGLENPTNYKMGTVDIAQDKTVTAGNASYGAVTRAVDGSDSTYWGTYSTLPWWISVDFGEVKKTAGFYVLQNNASYRGRAYEILGSPDGANWSTVYTGELQNIAEQTIEYPAVDYRYIRMNVTSYWSSARMYMYTLKIFEAISAGNESAFTITGLQRNPLKVGDLIPKTFQVASVERYEDEPDTILLSFDTNNRFNDVEGDITITYSQGLGTLAGTRPVESFSVDFAPEDLEPTPIDEHTITAGMDITVNLIDLTPVDLYTDHTLTAGMDITVALINVEDINP